MATIKINGITLYYEVHGQGEPLLMINGAGTDTSIWSVVLNDLAKHFQVILFDSRGAGKSDVPKGPYTTELLAEDTIRLLQHLKISSAHLIGHSLGGAVAQQIALNYPKMVKQLVLCGTFAKLNPVTRYVVKNSVDLYRSGMPAALVYNSNIPWLYSQEFLDDPQNLQKLFEKIKKSKRSPSQEGIAHQGEACLNHDTIDQLVKIPHQTLVVAAQHDLMAPLRQAEEMVALLPNGYLAVIENAAHLFIVENPREFCDIVIPFLQGVVA